VTFFAETALPELWGRILSRLEPQALSSNTVKSRKILMVQIYPTTLLFVK
jgi:hypothetical protein